MKYQISIMAFTLVISGCVANLENNPIKITNDPTISIGGSASSANQGNNKSGGSSSALQKPSQDPVIRPVAPVSSETSTSSSVSPVAVDAPMVAPVAQPPLPLPVVDVPPEFQQPPSSLPVSPTEPTGSIEVGISAEAPPPLNMAIQATRQDIQRFRLTIGGAAILQKEGRPRVLEQAFGSNQGKLWLPAKQLPVGFVDVTLEAMDASGQKIGEGKITQVPIRSGKTTRQRIHLKLIDTLLDDPAQPVGHLSMDVVITEGRKIVRKSAVVPKGGFLTLEGAIQTPSATRCQQGVVDFSAETVNPSLGSSEPSPSNILPEELALPALNLAELSGSSAGWDLFEGIGSSSDLNGASGASLLELPPSPPCSGDNLNGASVGGSTIPQSQPILSQLSFSASRLSLKTGDSLDLAKRLVMRYSDGQTRNPSITWSSSAPAAVQLNGNGVAKGLQVGSSLIMAKVDGKQALLTVLVKNTLPNTTTPEFKTPSATLVLSATQLKPGSRLLLTAQNPAGTIGSYLWRISNNLLQAQTLQPQTELIVWQTGLYAVQLYLKGTNGQIYPASNSIQKILVK